MPCWPLPCPPAARPTSGLQGATYPLPQPRSWLPAAACLGGRCHGMGPQVATLWLRQPFSCQQGGQGLLRHWRQGLGHQGALLEHSQAPPKQPARWEWACAELGGGIERAVGWEQHAAPRHSKACIATQQILLSCRPGALACRLGSIPQRPGAAS